MIMMIFVTTTDSLTDEKLYEKAYSLIPEYRKAKADKMKMRENKLQTVTAGLLLNYAVGKWSIKTEERDYKTDEKSQYKESENEIIMKTKNKILHINKETHNPTQMEIKDNKQKTTIYILYNEVKVNSTQ